MPQDAPRQISRLGGYMKQLQELAETDPEKFSETMSSIAESLEEAAATATGNGDTEQAERLTDLADKFSTAAETGTVPDLRPEGAPPMGPPPENGTSGSTNASGIDLSALFQTQSSDDPLSVLTGILSSFFPATSEEP